MGGCNQRFVCAGLHALLVELVYQRLLKQASLGEEMCEFGAQVLLRWLGAHQIEHCAINFRPQSGAIDQDQSLYPLRIASGKGKSYCPSERVADDAHALPIWTKRVEKACQELGQCGHAVVGGRFGAAARTNEVECANAELLGKCGQV